jgi:tetratricopeptide (TPR) repeat protein
VAHFERLSERRSDRAVALRLAEIYSRLRQFDKAEARLAAAVADGGRDAVIDQLEASVAEGKGDALAAQGRSAEAVQAYAVGLTALKRARDAAPTNPIILVQEASLLRKQADAGGDRAKLTAALAAADQATRLRGDFWPAAQAKSDLLLATGDVPGAIAELERFVRGVPSSTEGRRRLIEVLGATGNTGRALEVAREAIAMTPNDPLWYVAVGEIELMSGRVEQAIAAYETADRLRPSPETLHRLTDLRMRRSAPDWAGIIAGLRDRSDDVRNSPYLQSAVAAALVNTGQERQGLDALRDSYRFARRSIAEGLAQPSILDGWYGNLRQALPARRNADAERFLLEVAGSDITARDYRALAELWLGAGGDGPRKALEWVAKGLAADDGKDPRVTGRLHDIAGSAHYLLGDCMSAVDSFERAVAVLPNEAVLLNNFAYLCAECGDDPKRGLAAAERAVLLAPNRADFLDTLGYVQARNGDRAAAIESLLRSLRIAPNASANFHLAQIMLEENRAEEARRYLRAAGDLKPDPVLQAKINDLIERLR